mmetsp:Transcript_10101/g.21610  ORF Transcript_10101/g.21610 Transcript_10101/m.21610 type:complete len:94 (+) Transcript_10101:397-678(+)
MPDTWYENVTCPAIGSSSSRTFSNCSKKGTVGSVGRNEVVMFGRLYMLGGRPYMQINENSSSSTVAVINGVRFSSYSVTQYTATVLLQAIKSG